MAEDSRDSEYVAYEVREDLPKGSIIFLKIKKGKIYVSAIKRGTYEFVDPETDLE